MPEMRALGVAVARGGSVGFPRKNVALLAGKPLIVRAIESGAKSKLLTRCVVSTDDEEIASVSQAHGGDVPFIRPAALAESDSSVFDVLAHAVDVVEAQEGIRYDDVVLLQPTNPFRTGDDIDSCLRLLRQTDADSVITLYEHPSLHPDVMYRIDEKGRTHRLVDSPRKMVRRQERSPVFCRSGLVYTFKRRLLKEHDDIYGNDVAAYVVAAERAVDIDSEFDLAFCEFLWQRLHSVHETS